MPEHDTAPATASATPTPCECAEPDGYCEACEDSHGHTCIMCGHDFCNLCWETEGHNEDCKREVYEDGSIGIVYAENVKRGAADS